jgi:hypothetical protein
VKNHRQKLFYEKYKPVTHLVALEVGSRVLVGTSQNFGYFKNFIKMQDFKTIMFLDGYSASGNC